ncbi:MULTISPECIES: hypothetical protein [Alkalihalobacterium]|uniref:YfhD family protein n=1 Tax=Alkalihalobacterium chitinilyticum TaxID=2980103 RepID=A0ABT5VBH5_9BACI|nr:hypothetical protein [Alkalihalobacterium chitinilyticum]MDE5412790.1 hypothetical protein [Alkalihalobacterium chitinilyticum]
MKKRRPQEDKALTNNQTPTESMFNEETSSELVDQPKKRQKKKK